MSTVTEFVDVDVPIRTAYNQWTQFEDFPHFMEGVKEIKQVDDVSLHWTVEIAGQVREFDAKITEQNPDERIAWTTIDGPHQAGVVTFHRLGDNQTKVMLQMEYEPEGIVEKAGAALGVVTSRVKGDLERFKSFIESRGQETGAWRGEVDQAKTS